MNAAPRLVIQKRMQFIQGKVRPICFIQAFVPPAIQATLEEHYMAETLFRRSAYAASWPAGAIPVPPALAPSLNALLKNDACPEITVKTMLSGQQHQAVNVWEMLSFEFVAKLSFDNFLEVVRAAAELNKDIPFYGTAVNAGDVAAFEGDTTAELRAIGHPAPRLMQAV